MPSNIEIKAKVTDLKRLCQLAAEASNSSGTIIKQDDTFFNVPNGRLKLRELRDAPAQLVYYDRPDQAGPKHSDYHISLIEHPQDLKVTLEKALGKKGQVVIKERTLYMVGQTRVHVDKVEGLGDFMELEVVMKEGQSLDEGQQIAEDLMAKLEIKDTDLIDCAYMDLLEK